MIPFSQRFFGGKKMAKNDSPVISNVKSPKKARDISPERADRFKDWLEDIPNTVLTDW